MINSATTSAQKTDLSSLITSGAILIDVRSPRYFKQYSLHDSFNFPLSTLEHNWKILKSFDRPLILVCDDGELCSKAKKILTMKNVDSHIGGDWKNFL